MEERYVEIALSRVAEAKRGAAKYRSLEKSIHAPSGKEAVARVPAHFSYSKSLIDGKEG
jgi:hypothetical protein